MPEPEKVKFARQVIAQQLVADLVAKADDEGFVWRSELARISEEDLDAVKVLAAAGAPSAEQFEAACDFLSQPPAPEDDSSRARGRITPQPHLHFEVGAPVGETWVEGRTMVWHVPEGLIVGPPSPFDPSSSAPAVITSWAFDVARGHFAASWPFAGAVPPARVNAALLAFLKALGIEVDRG